jgi:hypothetical protein
MPLFVALFSLLSGLAQAGDCGREALVGRSAKQGLIIQAARESRRRNIQPSRQASRAKSGLLTGHNVRQSGSCIRSTRMLNMYI